MLGEQRDVIAVATDDGISVNRGFGNSPEFRIYSLKDGKEIETVRIDLSKGVSGKSHRDHISSILVHLNSPKYIAVSEIGPYPEKVILDQNIRLIVTKEKIRDLMQRLD